MHFTARLITIISPRQRTAMPKPYTLAVFILVLLSAAAKAQTSVKGKVIDAVTKEPLHGASIRCSHTTCNCACVSGTTGEFELMCEHCESVEVSYLGYQQQIVTKPATVPLIELTPSSNQLNEVIVSASRGEKTKRSEAPVAIGIINQKTLQDAKAVSFDQVLNKVSGVNMVNLGNEQHQMSIRQPMTTKSLFLYLEDGIPVRTTGLYNHNALLEINMAAVKNIEVIKGPSSSLYGSEAIGGVVNLTTLSPTATPLLKLSLQANDNGYKRTDLQAGFTTKKWGFALSGYYADKRNSFIEYTDFHKGTITARVDYRFSEKTSVATSLTWLKYHSDMAGGVDSTMFATKKLVNPQTFTYREVDALRIRSTLTQSWNQRSKTTVSLVYRDNTIGQNPAYRIKDDYRKQGNAWIGKKNLAHGEINESSFNSYGLIVQHRQRLPWKNAVLLGGASMDLSPSTYNARYISITKDTIANKYTSFDRTDSILTNYSTRINNYALFAGFEFDLVKNLKWVMSLRYDRFDYDFNNHLPPSAFSGSADTVTRFERFSPKVGFTYRLNARIGFYANYSQGFVPPQVTEMFTGVKVPDLKAATFFNYETGGWAEIIRNRFSIDWSIYQLDGSDEVISVKLNDGSFENRNAGKTRHRGIEFGMNITPVKDVTVRFSGAYSVHRFIDFAEKGQDYSRNEMNNAPRWLHNTEIWYKPSFAKGLRIGAEWQKVGSYYMDAKNTVKYKGYDLINLRAGYQRGPFEIWLNVMNVADNYFSWISSKSNSGHSYQLADPRTFNAGISYDLGRFFKKS